MSRHAVNEAAATYLRQVAPEIGHFFFELPVVNPKGQVQRRQLQAVLKEYVTPLLRHAEEVRLCGGKYADGDFDGDAAIVRQIVRRTGRASTIPAENIEQFSELKNFWINVPSEDYGMWRGDIVATYSSTNSEPVKRFLSIGNNPTVISNLLSGLERSSMTLVKSARLSGRSFHVVFPASYAPGGVAIVGHRDVVKAFVEHAISRCNATLPIYFERSDSAQLAEAKDAAAAEISRLRSKRVAR